jgi:hypothetical protein
MNLNRILREELQAKISHLKSNINIIDENAQKAFDYFTPNSVDISCFHHAINDALQTAVSEPRGMDTAKIEWWSKAIFSLLNFSCQMLILNGGCSSVLKSKKWL